MSNTFGLDVGERTVARILHRGLLSHKVVTKYSNHRNTLLRDHFYARSRTFRIDQIVAIDESAANERSAERKRGWAPLNVPCEALYRFDRTPRWSILPAIDANRYFAWEIISGGYTKELFEAFVIEQVLPYCNPFPGLRSIVLMDNASQHDIPRLRAICSSYGVYLEQLPLYSPDLNPIEQSFRVLKAWI